MNLRLGASDKLSHPTGSKEGPPASKPSPVASEPVAGSSHVNWFQLGPLISPRSEKKEELITS